MTLVVMGEGTTIRAGVVYALYREEDKNRKMIFIQTRDTDSVEKALQILLEMTMVMINKTWTSNFFVATGHESKVMEGHGIYYEPTQRR